MNIWQMIKSMLMIGLVNCCWAGKSVEKTVTSKNNFLKASKASNHKLYIYLNDLNEVIKERSFLLIKCRKSSKTGKLEIEIYNTSFLEFLQGKTLSGRCKEELDLIKDAESFVILVVDESEKKVMDCLYADFPKEGSTNHVSIKEVKTSLVWDKPNYNFQNREAKANERVLVLKIQDGAEIKDVAIFLNTTGGSIGVFGRVRNHSKNYKADFAVDTDYVETYYYENYKVIEDLGIVSTFSHLKSAAFQLKADTYQKDMHMDYGTLNVSVENKEVKEVGYEPAFQRMSNYNYPLSMQKVSFYTWQQ